MVKHSFLRVHLMVVFAMCLGGTIYAADPTSHQVAESSSADGANAASSHIYAVKTNVLLDAATALNLEFECSFDNHWSLSIPVYYNPFLFSRNYTVKLLAIQPEARYWFASAMTGWFVGAHLMTGFYNVYVPGDYRYQDANGKSPCIGGGVSAGYSLSFARHWAVEFTLGMGYVYCNYDRFYKVENGAFIDSNTQHYFGPTKAGITLVYKFNDNQGSDK